MKKSREKSLLPRLVLCLCLAAVSLTCHAKRRVEAPPAAVPDVASVDWVLQLPDEPVSASGVVNFDSVGSGPGGMMYPAPNAAGLLAAIVTHGVLQGAAKRKQRDQAQEAADQVLGPYLPTLASLRNRDIAEAALLREPFGERKSLAAEADLPAGAWRIASIPHFSLTQDQRAFIIDNAIALYAPGASNPSYQTSVRVISHPRNGDDLAGTWTGSDGAELKKEWAYLLSESIETALRSVAATSEASPPAFATVRYPEGGVEKIERAQPLYQACGRVVLKTLRGALMSVPAKGETDNGTDATVCPAS